MERVQGVLSGGAIGCAVLVALGGLASRSRAWTEGGAEGVSGWQDGVRPWAVWAVLGGVAVAALLWAGRERHRALWIVAGLGGYALWEAARGAAAHRERLESGTFFAYDQHRVALGLRVVPVIGILGAVAVMALAVVTLAFEVTERGSRSGYPASSVTDIEPGSP